MVLDIKKGNEWQYLSKDGFSILPWFVRPALDVLESMDLSLKSVFEYGLGYGTIWFAHAARMVHGVDESKKWRNDVIDTLIHNELARKAVLLYETEVDWYVEAICGIDYDIIVVDGDHFRDECTKMAFEVAKAGAIIILDNWMQKSVFVASKEVQDIVKKHQHTIYYQPGHPDWATLIAIK